MCEEMIEIINEFIQNIVHLADNNTVSRDKLLKRAVNVLETFVLIATVEEMESENNG